MKKVQRSIIFVIGILLWVMQGQSVFAAGSTELLSGTIANTTISYRLTEDGTLTIYSDNIEEMPNYTVNSTVPWAAQKDKIKKVQINSYLKNIGDYAFYGCDSLESVVIQDSKLTEIGFMRKNRGTAEDFDSFRWVIIWYFTKQMMKLK